MIVDVPTLRDADGPSIVVQPADVAGHRLWVCTIRERDGRRRDRWHATEAAALAHGCETADALGLLLIRLADEGAD